MYIYGLFNRYNIIQRSGKGMSAFPSQLYNLKLGITKKIKLGLSKNPGLG